MDNATIQKIVQQNRKYQETDGKDGAIANLSGATLPSADLRDANLSDANLSSAYLRGANLRGADLSDANLSDADLRGAKLRDADLRGAKLRGADLRGAKLRGAIGWETTEWARQAKQQLRYVLFYSRAEVPRLIEKIQTGQIDGTQYEGQCTCLIGSIDNDKAVKQIPDYEKGLHNPSEQLFWQIKEGDTPENSDFAKLALEICLEFL
jgi:uncharacterized protein YjbI with pentapeptide repeats